MSQNPSPRKRLEALDFVAIIGAEKLAKWVRWGWISRCNLALTKGGCPGSFIKI